MALPPAPDSNLVLVNCKCAKGCENNRCSCRKSGLVQMYANVPIAKTVMKIPRTRLIRILTNLTIMTAQVIASSKAINKRYVYPYLV